MFEHSSTAGLVALQIGVMFALLFGVLAVYNWTNGEYFNTIIDNQETIIQLLNSTK